MRRAGIPLGRVIVPFLAATACGDARTDAPMTGEADRPSIVVYEDSNALWSVEADGSRRRLTATRVAGFDHDSLAALQREGEVILYWAVAPVVSPDGRFVAYASTRESVATGRPGQSVWLLDLETGEERPLLHDAGRAFRAIGWFEGDVVYIGDEPGVHAVSPADGRRRLLAPGTALDVARDGSTLVVADGVPDSTRVRVLRSGQSIDVPPPADGLAYQAQAWLEGRHLLIEAADASGTYRRFLVFDVAARRLTEANLSLTLDGSTLPAEDVRGYLERSMGFTSRGGRVFCSYAPLGQDDPTAYVWALCEEWVAGPDSLEPGSASSGPVALMLERDGDRIRIAAHRVPRDGAAFARDLRAIFPEDVRRRISTAAHAEALRRINRATALRCYDRSSAPCVWRGEWPGGAGARAPE